MEQCYVSHQDCTCLFIIRILELCIRFDKCSITRRRGATLCSAGALLPKSEIAVEKIALAL
jgi:hypothetical protein